MFGWTQTQCHPCYEILLGSNGPHFLTWGCSVGYQLPPPRRIIGSESGSGDWQRVHRETAPALFPRASHRPGDGTQPATLTGLGVILEFG
ncbi:hypothetical protein V6N13_057038 [Hibiscus sabdariffa]|uniref:Uncharacterized protein n=1 Tax=Hibiscus sabdariffa TaxID=183260 RepID=A0ABR2D351_9ROSI